MLAGDVAMICEGSICKTCVEMGIQVIEIAVNPDHFVLGELPLLARRMGEDKLVIKKLEKFDLDHYDKGDKKPMSENHIETVKSKLAEVLT